MLVKTAWGKELPFSLVDAVLPCSRWCGVVGRRGFLGSWRPHGYSVHHTPVMFSLLV